MTMANANADANANANANADANANANADTRNKRCLELTRNLYPRDEAELSLMFAILEKQPCEMCLFWACELIYSGFDIGQLMWSIYYDFYAQMNPGLVVRVADALQRLREGDAEKVLMVIKTLRVKKATDNVFSLRISQTPTKFTIYKGRVPSWLAGFPAEQRPLLRAVCGYDWNQIMLYLSRRAGGSGSGSGSGGDDPRELVKSILRVMMEKGIIAMKSDEMEGAGGDGSGDGGGGDGNGNGDDGGGCVAPSPEDIVEALWDSHGYNDEYHIVLALLVSLITPDEQCDFGKRLIKLNDAEKSYTSSINRDSVVSGLRGFMRLLWRRLCKPTSHVSAFDIARPVDMDARAFSRELVDNWPFHCSRTPYWNGVFAKYKVLQAVCAEKPGHGCEVSIHESMEEAFWRDYGFLCDLDEPAVMGMWEATCADVPSDGDGSGGGGSSAMDVVDVMDAVFGGSSVEELRMEFDDVVLSSERRRYGTTAGTTTRTGEESNDVFNFSVLDKLLDSM